MLQVRFGVVHFVLALTLLRWHTGTAVLAEAAPQPFDSSIVVGMEAHSTSSEEKSATDLAAKLLLLDELVSLENDVIETKKKRSFPGFGSPLDRLSASSVDLKGKQREDKAEESEESSFSSPPSLCKVSPRTKIRISPQEGGGVAQETIWNSSRPNRNEPSRQHQGLADGASASMLDD